MKGIPVVAIGWEGEEGGGGSERIAGFFYPFPPPPRPVVGYREFMRDCARAGHLDLKPTSFAPSLERQIS